MARNEMPRRSDAPVELHTLYVKPGCRYCDMMLGELERANVRGEFNVVDASRGAEPTVKYVPSISVDGEMRTGREAFAFILSYIANTPQSMGSGPWESITSPFAFIDDTQSDLALTNSGMSCVFTSLSPPTTSTST